MKTRNLKLDIEYDGTDFSGWQVQSAGVRTVQEEIEGVLAVILKEKVRLYGSGRTDSGVHACGQVANFKTVSTIPSDVFCRALNAQLPPDVVILRAEEVEDDFHAQFSAKRKTYRYTVLNRQEPCAIQRRFCTHIPYPLDLSRMKRAAAFFKGSHDFQSFMAADPAGTPKETGVRGTVRHVFRSDIFELNGYLIYEIEADGFLYKMVRNIVGTLIAVGNGRVAPEEITDIFNVKDREAAGDTAPPQGLCLMRVIY